MKFLDINDCEFFAIKNKDKDKLIKYLKDNEIEFKKFVSSYQLFCENEIAFLYEECYKDDVGYILDERFQEIYNELNGISPFIRIN